MVSAAVVKRHITSLSRDLTVNVQAVTQVRMHVQKRILKASYFPSLSLTALQEWAKEGAPGWVKFIPAVAYHLCLNLAVQFSKPGAHVLAQPCTIQNKNVA